MNKMQMGKSLIKLLSVPYLKWEMLQYLYKFIFSIVLYIILIHFI